MAQTNLFLRHKLPTYRIWVPVLTRRLGSIEARVLLARVEGKYSELLARSPQYSPRVLQKLHFQKNILPAIAVYKIMQMDGYDPNAALARLDELLEATVEGQKRLYCFWSRFPFFFNLLRWVLKPFTLSQYPPEGWKMEFPELGSDAVGLDSYSCFYLRVLMDYGLPELTRHFCRLDDVLYESVGPSIRFERTQTLGRGGTMCDFRYYRVKTNQG